MRGIPKIFLCTLFNTVPHDSAASEEAGFEPRTVGILALEAYLLSNTCNHSGRSHPQLGYISFTTWLDLIHNLARSHSQLG